MESLLLLVHRIPYPPNKGDKIRSYNLLKHLSQHYNVFLATFVDDPDDWQHVPKVQEMCALAKFMPLEPRKARVRSLKALFGNRSLSLDYYHDAALHSWVRDVMSRQPIRRVVVFSSAMAQYAEPFADARRVVDFCDVDSDKWRQYAETKPWPMSWLFRHEARQLLAYERKVASECDASLFVSAPEAQLFRDLAPESAAKTGHFSNGVDTDFFAPSPDYASPYGPDEQAIVFCGAMDYWPNIDAVQWFAKESFPAVRARHPHARFYIVGARPTPDVQALSALPGVVVTGTVPDVRPYVAHAALSVAPLRIARGIQNKVLEAMSMAKTVVLSPQALEGIDAQPNREVLLAHNAAEFAGKVNAVLAAPSAAMGAAARAAVEQHYGWSAHLSHVLKLLEAS